MSNCDEIKKRNATPKAESNINLEQIKEEFTIEKAVIYSEILKPKYLEYE